jgi:hypothetical protein
MLDESTEVENCHAFLYRADLQGSLLLLTSTSHVSSGGTEADGTCFVLTMLM